MGGLAVVILFIAGGMVIAHIGKSWPFGELLVVYCGIRMAAIGGILIEWWGVGGLFSLDGDF